MELTDFIPVIVPYSPLEREVYRNILMGAGLSEPVFIDPREFVEKPSHSEEEELNKLALSQRVAEVVGEQKAVIIGEEHNLIAFCYNDESTTLLTFDKHDDSYVFDKRPEFGNGNFLTRREGDTHILGYKGWGKPTSKRVRAYSPRKIQEVLDADISDRIFLSLDIDVFNTSVTTAHNDPPSELLDPLCKLFNYEGHLSFGQVLALSKELVSGRELVGLNIAEYRPGMEEPPYKTAEMLRDYIHAVLTESIRGSLSPSPQSQPIN